MSSYDGALAPKLPPSTRFDSRSYTCKGRVDLELNGEGKEKKRKVRSIKVWIWRWRFRTASDGVITLNLT